MGSTSTKLTRRSFIGAAGIAGMTLAACGNSGDGGATGDATTNSGVVTGSFEMHVQGYDYGCGVDKVTITLDAPLDEVAPEDFVVSEHKQATDWADETYPVVEADFPREVTAASIEGNTLTLELACDPANGSPLIYTVATDFNTWADPYQLNITLAEGAELTSGGAAVTEVVVDPNPTGKTTSADAWKLDSYECADGTVYPFAAYEPEGGSKNLFVWFHGSGEGGIEGTDPYVTILANKVVALSEEEFQTTVGGAYVIAPQCPDFWMNIGDNTYLDPENSDELHCIYTESAEEFIDAYAEKVGAENIVLGGCSNGGFMSYWLAIHRPERYAGVVPICEGVYDALITDEQIEDIKDIPTFFIYCVNDSDESVHQSAPLTIERLKKAGMSADKLHVFTCEKVVDTSGAYTQEDGSPYEYDTHWSWIYFDNNEAPCNDDGLAVFDFVAGCFA